MSTSATENYLKAVYNAGEWSTGPVTVSALAARLGLSVSSTSEKVQKLVRRGLVRHAPYGDVQLTAEGRRIALATVRKHRLIETFLVEYLDYGWDEVHDEAEVLEHAVSDLFVERLYTTLGCPERDPHGDPIPTAEGTLPHDDPTPLDGVDTGTEVEIVRVWDDDPEFLRQLDDLRVGIGSRIRVSARHDALGTITVHGPQGPATLATTAARAIRVRVVAPAD